MAKRSGQRPANVPAEATGGAGGQWILARGDESFLWAGDNGVLVTHTKGDLETRYDVKGRLASRGNWGTLADGRSRRPDGRWEYGPDDGAVRRESFWVLGVEHGRTWFQHGLMRSGGIAQIATHLHPIDVEVGPWIVRDGDEREIQTIELGRAFSDDELLEHPAMAEATLDANALAELAGPVPTDAASLCAAIRLAARLDVATLARIPVRPERWSFIPHSFAYWHDGEPEPLLGKTLASRLQAVYWGTPWDEVLEAAGEWLIERGRPIAALDFLDAVTGLRGAMPAALAACLVTLGREDEAVESDAMTREEALLVAKLGAATDDEMRRPFANELAELIDLERAGESVLRGRAALLRAYARDTKPTKRSIDTFVASLPQAMLESVDPRDFARGFADGNASYINAEAFLAHANDLVRLFPASDRLNLIYASGVMARLAASPSLSRYRTLTFTDTYLFRGGAAHLGGCRFLTRLEELGLNGTSMYDEDLARILGSPHLGALRELDIGNPRAEQNYTLDGLRPIVESIFAPRLETLSIARRYFESDVIDDVIARLPKLTSVDLEAADLGEPGAIALAELPHRFVTLNLERCRLNPAAIAVLANSPVLGPCTSLDLGGNPLAREGLLAIARSPHLGNLGSLGIGGLDDDARPDGEFVEELARGAISRSIKSLDFGLGNIGPRGAHALANGTWPALARLELYGNKIFDDGAIALFQSPMFAMLRYVDLGDNDLTDVSGIALAESPYAGDLAHIELGGALFEKPTRDALVKRFGTRIQFEYPWVRNARRASR